MFNLHRASRADDVRNDRHDRLGAVDDDHDRSGAIEARAALAGLLRAFRSTPVSPCTTMALGNLAMVAGLVNDPSVEKARRCAAERGETDLESALRAAAH